MSFSSVVKNEICRKEIIDHCCAVSEISAILRVSGKVSGEEIHITTENAAFARRFIKLMKFVFNIHPELDAKRSNKLKRHISFSPKIIGKEKVENILDRLNLVVIDDCFETKNPLDVSKMPSCCIRSYARGAFLCSGAVSDPEKTYHLEVACHKQDQSLDVNNLMKAFSLHPKTVIRKNYFVSYIKEGEDIVDFLNMIGAYNSLMKFENVRILKDVRNSVNRIVNCDTANLQKTVDASINQIGYIEKIDRTIGIDSLSEDLYKLAMARIENTDLSLRELGQILAPPLGKSGVSHRMKKIFQIADKIKE